VPAAAAPGAAARRHLAAIAGAPRPAGSDAEALARAHCADALRAAGFTVRERPFAYSAAVGGWGMPAAGLAWIATLAAAARAGGAGRPWLALGILVGALAALAAVAPRAAADGVLGFPALRRRATNLVATRGGDAPAVWLVAHVDSKSQPVPMAARVVGVAATALGWVAAVGLAAAQALGAPVAPAWAPLALVGGALALPVVGSVIGDRSPGALDNASGVVTVLLAATEPLPDAPPLPAAVGVTLTPARRRSARRRAGVGARPRAARPGWVASARGRGGRSRSIVVGRGRLGGYG
jgi:hypothetical protein